MTTAQKNVIGLLLSALAVIGIPAVTAAVSYGRNQEVVAGKESQADHQRDLQVLRDTLRVERVDLEIYEIRDSVWKAIMLERITDAACDQSVRRRTRRSYCPK